MKANILTHQSNTSNTSLSKQPDLGLHSGLPRLLKKHQLAKELSVSSRTIDKWVEKRLIPFIQFSPGFNRFEIEAVLETIKEKFQILPLDRS